MRPQKFTRVYIYAHRAGDGGQGRLEITELSFGTALNNHINTQALPRNAADAARTAAQAVKALTAQIPQDPFTTEQVKALAEPLPKVDDTKREATPSKKGGKKG